MMTHGSVRALSVRALEKDKIKKEKETHTKLKGRALHWPKYMRASKWVFKIGYLC